MLHPSVDIDLDFADAQAAAEFEGEFARFLTGIPAREAAEEPSVEFHEDDHAVWLRGTIWLPAYDELLALAVQRHVAEWARGKTQFTAIALRL